MRVKTCADSVLMAQIIVPLIAEQTGMSAGLRSELLKQLSVYFEHTGVLNKEIV